jgi:hypothetical protein
MQLAGRHDYYSSFRERIASGSKLNMAVNAVSEAPTGTDEPLIFNGGPLLEDLTSPLGKTRRGEGAKQASNASPSFAVHSRRHRLLRATALALTITILTTLCFVDRGIGKDLALSASVTARSVQHYARAAGSVLEVFEVYPPVLTVIPSGALEITDGSSNASIQIIDNHRKSCQQVIVDYPFAYSYGAPFVGNFTPPSCSFNRVTWNLTVTSHGRQFDRLGIVYLGDTEVFRTSTAEPTANGIEWTYLKVSRQNSVTPCTCMRRVARLRRSK